VRVRTAANNSQLRTTAFEIFLHVFLSIASKVSQFFFPENNTGGDACARFVGHPIFQHASSNLLSRTSGFRLHSNEALGGFAVWQRVEEEV
jgi:hypothetical protein